MKKTNLYTLTACALMAALLCVLGPMTVPIGPIPITLANFILYLTVYLLGMKGALLTTVTYLLLGAVGLPVFSNFQGGLAKLLGPTGGFLFGDLFVALIGGYLIERFHRNDWMSLLALILATAVLYTFGAVWFVFLMKTTIAQALSVCVVPFIPLDLGKIVAAVVFGKLLRATLSRAKLLPEA